ncbi:hypothetical protein AHAS_Ahas09G0200400 [Arachis hypogaea]
MLQVGMKFNTKQEFMEAVRDFTIQKGRQIKFRKNERYRARTVCKWKNEEVKCPLVAYASKDHEEICWQLKTFNNEHKCPRKNKIRIANKKWLAQNLVKKLRKCSNLKHCEVAAYFKRRCDLDLNKSSLTRALIDARNMVYGDAVAQYGRLRYYGETLLKSNLGSIVKIGVIPQVEDDLIFQRMYICLDGCKK